MGLLDAALLILLVRAVISNAWAAYAVRYLRREPLMDVDIHSDRRLVLILPVLAETELIASTITHLLSVIGERANVELWIVGTARERDERGENPTLSLARQTAGKHPQVKIFEDPRTFGWMAHQVNYALGDLLVSCEDTTKTWVFLVNIDGRISLSALRAIYHHINCGVPIVQQSAVFLGNYEALSPLMRGFALWQSRWTLIHELRRLVIYRRVRFALVHVVGHGLCISLSTLSRFQQLPEDTVTEDLHFGFYLAAHAEPIEHIPILEVADSPGTLSRALRQKYVWSFGPMQYPLYLMKLRRKFPITWPAVRARAIVLCIQGMISYVDWSLVSWILIALAIVSGKHVVAALVLAVYLADYLQCLLFFRRAGFVRAHSIVTELLATCAAILMHSAPANVALIDVVLGRRIVKHKTAHE